MSRKYIYCFQVSSNFLLLLLLGDLFDSEKQQQKNSIISQLSLNFVKRKTGKKKKTAHDRQVGIYQYNQVFVHSIQ